jgi:hypothetical protein
MRRACMSFFCTFAIKLCAMATPCLRPAPGLVVDQLACPMRVRYASKQARGRELEHAGMSWPISRPTRSKYSSCPTSYAAAPPPYCWLVDGAGPALPDLTSGETGSIYQPWIQRARGAAMAARRGATRYQKPIWPSLRKSPPPLPQCCGTPQHCIRLTSSATPAGASPPLLPRRPSSSIKELVPL